MDDAQLVRRGKSGRDLARDDHGAAQRQRPLVADHLAEVLAFHVLHDDERTAVLRHVQVVHAHRVGMLQAARDHGLVAEAAQEVLVVGQAVVHDLDGAHLPEGEVSGPVHRGHPPRPQLAEDLVLAPEDHPRLQLGRGEQVRLVLGTGPELVRKDGMAGRTVTHGLVGHCSPSGRRRRIRACAERADAGR
jgi:hypothetical protein